MERIAPQPAQATQDRVPSLANVEPSSLVPPLEELAATARNMPGEEGRTAHRALHLALETLQPMDANGAQLLRLLDEHAFDELRADDGTSTRQLAVEALLRQGYPWALRVHPDELAWLRAHQFAAKRARYFILLGVLAIGAIGAALFYAWY